MYYHHLQDMEAHPAFSPKNLRGPPQMQRFPPMKWVELSQKKPGDGWNS